MRMRSITVSTLALLSTLAASQVVRAAPVARPVVIGGASVGGATGLSQQDPGYMMFADAAFAPRELTLKASNQAVIVAGQPWQTLRDIDTNAPVRMWGPSIRSPHSVADASAAALAARNFMAEHLTALAPGAALGDFVLVANELNASGDMRTVAFAQHHLGMPVLGGAIHMAFKNDHLFVVGSTALPNVQVAQLRRLLSTTVAAQQATTWMNGQTGASTRVRRTDAQPIILPMVQRKNGVATSVQYRIATASELEAATGVGRWLVLVDAGSGQPLARQSLIHFAQGTVRYNIPTRSPTGGRSLQPALFAAHSVNGLPVTADVLGGVMWAGNATATVVPGISGPRVTVINGAGGAAPSTSLSLAPNGTASWTVADEASEAQLAAFVFANVAKQFTKTQINPNLAYLEQQLEVHVNEQGNCNAYSTGDDIHFFPRDGQCENTGLIADVVYHEFGHSLHAQSIVRGVGDFDSALSEGLADFLAASITADPGMGRGFFFSGAALRDLDPVGREAKWPDDKATDPHTTGEIIAGALWDMRKGLIEKLGPTAGVAQTLKLFYAVMQRAATIDVSFVEALAADDNDGNLSNGTPNECVLIAAFKPHGLVDIGTLTGALPPTRDGFKIAVAVDPAQQARCAAPTIASAQVQWKVRGDAAALGNFQLAATATGWAGDIPAQATGKVVQYRVTVTFSDGNFVAYPSNRADPFYEFAVGDGKAIWCSDFENGSNGWSSTGNWSVGATGAGPYDPKSPFAGGGMYGLNLTGDGSYSSRATSKAESPAVDVAGYDNVHLRYRRWLTIEDGFFDKAKIIVNGDTVWTNRASSSDPGTNGVQHIDQEWRFQDVEVTSQAKSGKIKLSFELTADEGLEYGGWNIDDVCLVGNVADIVASCGNGSIEGSETCDDGNTVDGDGCNASCATEGGSGGCAATGSGGASSGLWAALLLALGFGTVGATRRRRRQASR